MMRGVLGLVSLLIIAVGGALYFTETQPVAEQQTYQKAESQANKAAALIANRGQAQVDAATGDKPAPPPATNAPPAGN
jgi:hypothetical protein